MVVSSLLEARHQAAAMMILCSEQDVVLVSWLSFPSFPMDSALLKSFFNFSVGACYHQGNITSGINNE
jgi:hypothetical protein